MPITLLSIGVGATAGDGNGDPARTAFQKVNLNAAYIAGAIEDAEIKAFTISLTDENETIQDRLVVLGDDDLMLYRIPYSFVLLDVRASLKVSDSGDDVVLDILENGISVLETGGLVIPAGSTTSVGGSPQPVIPSATILNNDNEIKIQHVSSATGGVAAGLKVTLIGYVIWTSF